MTRVAALIVAAVLVVFAGPAHATTPSTTPDCAEHGHDADHNKHCDESTTTTTGEATTTTTSLLDLPTNPTTTVTGPAAPTTTTTLPLVIEPPHITPPPTTAAPTTVAPSTVPRPRRLSTTGPDGRAVAAGGFLTILGGLFAAAGRRRPV